MFRIILSLLLVMWLLPATANGQPTLSESAEITILTCSPGTDLYSIFGHSAIRVKDSSLNLDEVYNYGTFNFNTPHFYLKFLNGELDYMLSAYGFKYFLPEYFKDERWVKEQVLHLNHSEKNRLFNALETNKLPQNKYYRYDFFFDNCATRIRDIVLSCLDDEFVYTSDEPVKLTFRDYLHLYQGHQPWTRDGMDLILGTKTDRIASREEATFLPDYLMDYFSHVQVKRPDGTVKLVQQEQTLLDFPALTVGINVLSPVTVTWLLFILLMLLLFYEVKRQKQFLWVDRGLLLLTGLCGVLFSYLWFFTEHTVTGSNLNIMWALPSNLVLLFFLKRIGKKSSFRYLALLTWALNGILLASWYWMPQVIPAMVFPLAFIQFIRLGKVLFVNQLRPD